IKSLFTSLLPCLSCCEVESPVGRDETLACVACLRSAVAQHAQALAATNGNVTAAAKKLGISRRSLHRKINEMNLPQARADAAATREKKQYPSSTSCGDSVLGTSRCDVRTAQRAAPTKRSNSLRQAPSHSSLACPA